MIVSWSWGTVFGSRLRQPFDVTSLDNRCDRVSRVLVYGLKNMDILCHSGCYTLEILLCIMPVSADHGLDMSKTLGRETTHTIKRYNQSTFSTAKRLASLVWYLIASTIDTLNNTINVYEIACIWNSKYNVHVCMIQINAYFIFQNLLFLFLVDFNLPNSS